MKHLLLTVVLLVGCEGLTQTADDWLTRDPPDQPSDAEHIVDSTSWLLPSPWRELTSAIVGGVAVFWTQRRRAKK
jgi:hypothetical protein